MNNLMNIAQRFREEEDGAAMVEYTVLLGVITAGAILGVLAISNYVSGTFSDLCTTLKNNNGKCTPPAAAPI